MSYTVTFHEVCGKAETLGSFANETAAISFIKSNVNTVDLETLGTAHINGTYEPWALYQDDDLLGCYHISAS